jgi:hypothetical protein
MQQEQRRAAAALLVLDLRALQVEERDGYFSRFFAGGKSRE